MYKYITRESELQEFIPKIFSYSLIAVDTETKGFDPHIDQLLLVQISTPEMTYIIDTRFVDLNKFTPYFNDYTGLWIFFNAKFDIKFLYHNYKILPVNVFDCMLAEILLGMGTASKIMPSLNDITFKYFNVQLDKSVRESFTSEITYFTDRQLEYAKDDSEILIKLYEVLAPKLKRDNLQQIADIEFKLTSIVAKMELQGINFNYEHWIELTKQAEQGVKESEALLREEVSKLGDIPIKRMVKKQPTIQYINADTINFGSPQQVKVALEKAGIKVISTGFDELSGIDDSPLVDSLLKYRSFIRKVNNYGYNFKEYINPITKRIHAQFNQLGTATGRFSSNDPNLQNIINPEKDKYSKLNYREAFIATPGYIMFDVDYSQIELRLAAEFSQEPNFINDYKAGRDVHKRTATTIFHNLMEEVTKDQRSIAKNTNFGILYGSGPANLTRKFKIPYPEAKQMIIDFEKGHPVLMAYLGKLGRDTVSNGFSTTYLGRRRYFNIPSFNDPEFNNKIAEIRREGANHTIQGSSADMLKIAMIKIDREVGKIGGWLLSTVHDELIGEVPEEHSCMLVEIVNNCMLDAAKQIVKTIPVEVDINLAKYWSKG